MAQFWTPQLCTYAIRAMCCKERTREFAHSKGGLDCHQNASVSYIGTVLRCDNKLILLQSSCTYLSLDQLSHSESQFKYRILITFLSIYTLYWCCAVVECPSLENPSNGMVNATVTFFDSVATYTCNELYTLIGSSEVTCNESGVWSDTPPECLCMFLFHFAYVCTY